MSDQQNTILISLASFLGGLLVGVVITLFLAPLSGQELRGQISDRAQANWQRATDQLHQAQADMRQQMDAYNQQIRDQITAQFDQLQAKISKQTDVGTAETAAAADTTSPEGV